MKLTRTSNGSMLFPPHFLVPGDVTALLLATIIVSWLSWALGTAWSDTHG
jgi:hypothetical protein